MPFNIKISGIAAAVAFVLSLLLGLVSGGSFVMVLIRALIFGAVFFALLAGAQLLIGQFLPELFNIETAPTVAPARPAPGSVVDISVDDAGVSGAPDGGANGGENVTGASLDDLLSKIDMNKSEEANEMTEDGELDQNETDGYNEITDMQGEMLAGDGYKASKNSGSRDDEEKNVGKYNPKDLASAISTMLKR
jgi:hypothetical protein